MSVNIHNVVRREYPAWHTRAKIRKVDDHGNVITNAHAFGGELVRVSPRFQRHGANFRIRPERPAVFFAHFCFESGLLPSPLTAEECETEQGLEILQPLWEAFKGNFPKLESPFAASDQSTEPSLKDGFSFCILQVMVEQVSSVRTNTARPALRPTLGASSPIPGSFDAIRQKIESMRARNGGKPETPAPAKKKS